MMVKCHEPNAHIPLLKRKCTNYCDVLANIRKIVNKNLNQPKIKRKIVTEKEFSFLFTDHIIFYFKMTVVEWANE